MNVLSAKLQSKLESRPTNTMLRSETIQDTAKVGRHSKNEYKNSENF